MQTTTTTTEKPILPIVSGPSLRLLAIKVADMQDNGASVEHVKPRAVQYYKSMRKQCKKFEPYVDPQNPGYWDTFCRSGFCGSILKDACQNCQAFCYDFHPNAGAGTMPREAFDKHIAEMRAKGELPPLKQVAVARDKRRKQHRGKSRFLFAKNIPPALVSARV